MADTINNHTTPNAGTTQEAAVQQQTVDGHAATGKPPQKASTGDQVEQTKNASSDHSSGLPSSQNSAGQDAVSGRQRHGTNERAAKGGADAPSSTGANDSAVNGSAKAHTASPDDVAKPTTHAADQQSSAGAAGGSASKKRSAPESSSQNDATNGRRSRGAAAAADVTHDPEVNAKDDVAAPGTKDDSKRAKISEPVVIGGDSDKGPVSGSGHGGSLGSAVDANTTKPDLGKLPSSDAGEKKPPMGNDATASAGGGAV